MKRLRTSWSMRREQERFSSNKRHWIEERGMPTPPCLVLARRSPSVMSLNITGSGEHRICSLPTKATGEAPITTTAGPHSRTKYSINVHRSYVRPNATRSSTHPRSCSEMVSKS
ncbi:uncharacterized protein BT62DRAFT_449647 [Guyanagaster necrorhizus]|uniref:Uncharacterized protein n=1 Tax=Guyanagaster necrorhizus TaxID=856835 RepID=A0A9P7VJC6_9AGAR|nr:uncharacterized protein BT62DRAFT_449647 [Guyanagaster necrorhizus MCA 3950]KAG7442198.1 hypothetical protein BT62DRAFT_449647 [Guyanagaster necrorhizus MCA 3950]